MGKNDDLKSNKYCSVPQCKSRHTNDITLFSFPKDEALRKRWVDAIKIEKKITQHMQVCSRHFVKSDYILPEYQGTTKVRRLKKSAVPSQNLPWQFPNKRVSPTLAKARMERLKNRTQQKITTPVSKNEAHKLGSERKVSKNKPADDSPDEADINESTGNDSLDSEDNSDNIVKNTDVMVAIHDAKSIKKVESKVVEEDKQDVADTMVSRGPTRLGQQKDVLKCEFCGRKCLTPQALRTHQQIAHKNAKSDQISVKKTMNKPKETAKPTPVALITVKSTAKLTSPKPPTKINTTVKTPNESDLVERVLQDFDIDSDMDSDSLGSEHSDESWEKESLPPKKTDKRRIEFECPKCKKRFAVYFSAARHIQKYHNVKVDDVSGEETKPQRVEICTVCNMTVTGDVHTCTGPQKLSQGLVCTGCNQEFRTLAIFDMHKSGMHSEGVESMFFPTLDEFEDWKAIMQKQTKTQYSILDQNDTKKIHRCTHRAVRHHQPHMCPSSIIVQEFAKGFQVHYYPKHFAHSFEEYNLSEKFKKYSIASLMSFTASKLPDDSDEDIGDDLYLQFKKLADILVNEAAKINVNSLKKLMRKALEMVNIVTSYVEDEDDDMSSTLSVTQDNDDLQEQVKKAFKGFKKGELKRKAPEPVIYPAKKKKPVFQSTENTLKNSTLKVQPVRVVNPYQVPKLKEEIENVNETKKNTPEVQKNNITQSASFLDSYHEFVGKTMIKPATEKKPKNEVKKKQIVKTKMGQFKPSPTKKNVSLSPPTKLVSPIKNSSFIKDIEYEVKEQENDCNILILKI